MSKLQPAKSARATRSATLLGRAAAGDEAAVRELFRTHVDAPAPPGGAHPGRRRPRRRGRGAAGVPGRARRRRASSTAARACRPGCSASPRAARSTPRARAGAGSAGRAWPRASGSAVRARRPTTATSSATAPSTMLAKLPPEQRLVFVLHDVEGYTFAEISGHDRDRHLVAARAPDGGAQAARARRARRRRWIAPPPNQTMRVPPAVAGAERRARAPLQRRAVELDEVTRARMERSLVQAWRTHAAASVALPRARRLPAARACRARHLGGVARRLGRGRRADRAVRCSPVDRHARAAEPRASAASSCASATRRCRAAR